jgi:hypothetical protein
MERITIEQLQDEYVVCRTIGHSWDDNPSAKVDSDLFKSSTGCLVLRCVRCTTERFDYLNADMRVFQRYYRYPQHYTTVTGIKKPDFRQEMWKRSLLLRKPRRRNGKAVA